MLKKLNVIRRSQRMNVQDNSGSILQWIKGDVEGIKQSMAEYEKLQEYAREEAASKIK